MSLKPLAAALETIRRFQLPIRNRATTADLEAHLDIEPGSVKLMIAGRLAAYRQDYDELARLREIGRRGEIVVDEYSQTAVPSIYAIGDVTNRVSLTPVAIREGMAFVETVFKGNPTPVDHELIPSAVFTQPEFGTVGMTEEEVKEREISYEVGIARFRETSRGHIMGLDKGMLKMLFSLKTRRLLGCHIVGEGATELIHIGQAVLNLQGTLEYFVENTFNYPTLAEAYKIAALDAWNRMPPE